MDKVCFQFGKEHTSKATVCSTASLSLHAITFFCTRLVCLYLIPRYICLTMCNRKPKNTCKRVSFHKRTSMASKVTLALIFPKGISVYLLGRTRRAKKQLS